MTQGQITRVNRRHNRDTDTVACCSKRLIANMCLQSCEIIAHIIWIFSSVDSFLCLGFGHFSSCSVLLLSPQKYLCFCKIFLLVITLCCSAFLLLGPQLYLYSYTKGYLRKWDRGAHNHHSHRAGSKTEYKRQKISN